jgi:uncharacterized protein (DUF2062 family)
MAMRRHKVDYVIDTICRRQSAPMSAMAGLAAGLAAALPSSAAPLALLASQPV